MQGVQTSKAAKMHKSDLTYQYSKTLKEKRQHHRLGVALDWLVTN